MTALAVVASLILPPRYTATAQLLPPSDENDVFGLSAVLGGGLSSGLSKLRSGLAGVATPSDIMRAILSSRSVMERVAERCSISFHYRIRRPSLEKAVLQLREMTRISVGDDGVVRISVEAKSRTLAADIANTYVAELDSFLRYSNISRGRNLRIFVGHRLAQAESSLWAARETLKRFQQAHGVAAVDDETRVAIDAYARLKSQLIAREAELEAARSVTSDANPYTLTLIQEVAGLRDELSKIERGGSSGGFGIGFGVSLDKLPAVAAEFAKLFLSLRVQEESYATLYQQYEYARILEARDTPILTVLDYAVPPERRSFPKRTIIVVSVLVFSLLMGIVVAFIGEYFASLKTTQPAAYEDWNAVRSQLASISQSLRRRRAS